MNRIIFENHAKSISFTPKASLAAIQFPECGRDAMIQNSGGLYANSITDETNTPREINIVSECESISIISIRFFESFLTKHHGSSKRKKNFIELIVLAAIFFIDSDGVGKAHEVDHSS